VGRTSSFALRALPTTSLSIKGYESDCPRRLGAFLEGDLDGLSQLTEELCEAADVGRQDAPGDHPATLSRTEATVLAWWTLRPT
jgi:hypothetical protein